MTEMQRLILALVLLSAVGGIAFYFGRSTAPEPKAARSFVPPPAKDAEARARIAEPTVVEGPPIEARMPPVTGAPPVPAIDVRPPGESSLQRSESTSFDRTIGLPIAGLKEADVHDTFNQSRGNGERRHEATDILAPRGTPVVAVDTGLIQKLFTSKPGGLTVYQYDSLEKYCYYYAHLDRYAEGLKEGMLVKRGDRIGYVGVTGNSDPNVPHLHFAILQLGPEKKWWEGTTPINPYGALISAFKRR